MRKEQQLSQSSKVSLIFSAWVGISSSSQAQMILIGRHCHLMPIPALERRIRPNGIDNWSSTPRDFANHD
jgi:hypothetical protein